MLVEPSIKVLLCFSVAVLLASGCGDDSDNADRVVNIERQCELLRQGQYQQVRVSLCEPLFSGLAVEDAQSRAALILTIRTPGGSTYTINVSPNTLIEVNDVWPPNTGPVTTTARPATATTAATATSTVIALTNPTITASGLRIADVVVGSGGSPTTGQRVTVHYTGTLTNGTKFDSSFVAARYGPRWWSLTVCDHGWE